MTLWNVVGIAVGIVVGVVLASLTLAKRARDERTAKEIAAMGDMIENLPHLLERAVKHGVQTSGRSR